MRNWMEPFIIMPFSTSGDPWHWMMAAPTQLSIWNAIIQLWGLLKRLSTVVPLGKDILRSPILSISVFKCPRSWIRLLETTGSEAGTLNYDLEIIFPPSSCLTQDLHTIHLILFIDWCHGTTSLHVSSLISFPLCLYPTPSPSPSNSIWPHLPAFRRLCSNSKVYSCNRATSALRPALD